MQVQPDGDVVAWINGEFRRTFRRRDWQCRIWERNRSRIVHMPLDKDEAIREAERQAASIVLEAALDVALFDEVTSQPRRASPQRRRVVTWLEIKLAAWLAKQENARSCLNVMAVSRRTGNDLPLAMAHMVAHAVLAAAGVRPKKQQRCRPNFSLN